MSEKRKEIMAVACEALQKGGVNGFSFRDLADTVGIKSSSVHYHFRNKNELFKALVEDFRDQAAAHLQGIAANSGSLQEALFSFIDMFEGVLDEGKFCLCGILAADQQHLDEELIEKVNKTFMAMESWLKGVIDSYPQCSLATDSLALLLISSLEGSMLIDRLRGDKTYFTSLRECVTKLIHNTSSHNSANSKSC